MVFVLGVLGRDCPARALHAAAQPSMGEAGPKGRERGFARSH